MGSFDDIPRAVPVDESGVPLDAPAVPDRQPGYDRAADHAKEAEGVPELHEVDVPSELEERIRRHKDRYPDRRSASVPALWEVQRHYGWCTPEGIREAAAVLELTPAFLESVASFYDMLKLEPAGRHSVMVCTNISCWLRGGDELMAAFCEAAGTPPGGGTSPDGLVELEHFECLGACDVAPMASIDYRYYGPLEPGDARSVLDQLRAGEEVLPERRLSRRPAAGGGVPDDPRIGRRDGEKGEPPGQDPGEAGGRHESSPGPEEAELGAPEQEEAGEGPAGTGREPDDEEGEA